MDIHVNCNICNINARRICWTIVGCSKTCMGNRKNNMLICNIPNRHDSDGCQRTHYSSDTDSCNRWNHCNHFGSHKIVIKLNFFQRKRTFFFRHIKIVRIRRISFSVIPIVKDRFGLESVVGYQIRNQSWKRKIF